MRDHFPQFVSTGFFILATAGIGLAQAPIAVPPAPAPTLAPAPAQGQPARIPLKFQIEISRYQGDRKVTDLPYTLFLTANNNGAGGNLRLGNRVPVFSTQTSVSDGKQFQTASVDWMDVGTNIDFKAVSTDDGRFRVDFSVDDSSVMEGQTFSARNGLEISTLPTLRSFRYSTTFIMKDGQTQEFIAASDKISGEVVKMEVTLTVVK